ncbi:hypothetical protein [Pedobacter antarcticus]|uniref:hypothetical protein n=1 Tax=Pedobacter antarcticus TaxID=34086 RepID=UPI001C5A1E45|nr:hypothetical protein [Pedobacter antarcticus]
MDKYKINEVLDKLTVKEYRFALREIPGILQVSVNTFHNYRKIKSGEPQDIPYEKVKQLEILFGMENGALANEKMNGKSLVELFKGQY